MNQAVNPKLQTICNLLILVEIKKVGFIQKMCIWPKNGAHARIDIWTYFLAINQSFWASWDEISIGTQETIIY